MLLGRNCELPQWELDVMKVMDEQYEEYLLNREIFVYEMNSGGNYRSNMSSYYPYLNKKGGVFVYFESGETGTKPKKDDVSLFLATSVIEMADRDGQMTSIYVSPGKINRAELDMLDKASSNMLFFEIHLHETLLMDRQFHVMNPVCKILTKKERDSFYNRTGTSRSSFPFYSRKSNDQEAWNDPFLLYNNVQRGDLVKIIQKYDYTPQIINKAEVYRVAS